MMLGRYEDAPPFKEQAAERGIELTEADLRWAGIAIFRKAHALFQERGYPSKLMAASMRARSDVDGTQRVWHLEKLAGANAVLTVFPNIFEAFLANSGVAYRPADRRTGAWGRAGAALPHPLFREAYDEHGLAPR